MIGIAISYIVNKYYNITFLIAFYNEIESATIVCKIYLTWSNCNSVNTIFQVVVSDLSLKTATKYLKLFRGFSRIIEDYIILIS